jgi:hypothetical protein
MIAMVEIHEQEGQIVEGVDGRQRLVKFDGVTAVVEKV